MSSDTSDGPSLRDAVLREMRALTGVVDQLDHAAAKRLEVNRTDYRCLEILGDQGPMTAKALAEAMGVTTGGMTTVIDRLERAGYARRTPHPHDRRQILVEPTSTLAARAKTIYGPLILGTQTMIDGMDDGDLSVVANFLHRWRELVQEHTQTIATPDSGSAAADIAVIKAAPAG